MTVYNETGRCQIIRTGKATMLALNDYSNPFFSIGGSVQIYPDTTNYMTEIDMYFRGDFKSQAIKVAQSNVAVQRCSEIDKPQIIKASITKTERQVYKESLKTQAILASIAIEEALKLGESGKTQTAFIVQARRDIQSANDVDKVQNILAVNNFSNEGRVSPVATFNRDSVAYDYYGNLKAIDVPRYNDGKFSKGIQIDEPTINRVINPDGKSVNSTYSVPGTYKPGWDVNLHDDAILVNTWSGGYNGGVPSPAIGYYAKWV
jgi:hypothetical protein